MPIQIEEYACKAHQWYYQYNAPTHIFVELKYKEIFDVVKFGHLIRLDREGQPPRKRKNVSSRFQVQIKNDENTILRSVLTMPMGLEAHLHM